MTLFAVLGINDLPPSKRRREVLSRQCEIYRSEMCFIVIEMIAEGLYIVTVIPVFFLIKVTVSLLHQLILRSGDAYGTQVIVSRIENSVVMCA